MLKKLMLLGLLMLLMVQPSFAQDEINNPLYVRYCTQTRQIQGEAALESAISDVENYLVNVEDFLRRVNGNLTYIEAVDESASILEDWNGSPVNTIPCLTPLERDMRVMLQELLIGMLYGLNLQPELSVLHQDTVTAMIAQIRQESSAAVTFLATPLPTPEPEVVVEEEAEPQEVERTPETLSIEMNDYLRQNQITVLREGAVQEFPEGYVISLVLDRFVLDGNDFDYDNTVFTLDTLARLVTDWDELATLQRIRVETYEGENLTLIVDLLGANFRAHYIENTLNRDAFLASFDLQEVAPVLETTAEPTP